MPFVLSSVGRSPICSIGDELYVGSHATSIRGVISAAAVEDDGCFYVSAITLSKSVQVLRSEDKHEWNVVAKHLLPKRLSAIKFALNPVCVVVSDTTGDVFRLPVDKDCNLNDNSVAETHLLLGHFSLVTDLAVRGNRVVTCDRDNRVRVSRFPDSFVIENFFLAHQDFVTCVDWVTDTRLVSTSGDGVVFIWDLAADTIDPVAELKLPVEANQSTIVVSAVVNPSNCDVVALVVDNSSKLYVVLGASEGTELSLGCVHTLDDHKPVNGAFFDSNGTLWASVADNYEIEGFRVMLPDASGNVGKVSLEPTWNVKLSCSDEAVPDSKSTHARTQWLKHLRRKPIVENWKGKKRKSMS